VILGDQTQVFPFRGIDYVHAPKIGSRSILGWFAIIKQPDLLKTHPEYFQEVKNTEGEYSEIRFMFNTTSQSNNDTRFCVTRDPVKRFVSGFKNRVHTHNKCNVKDFDEFVDNFEEIYGTNRDIFTHFRPQTVFYGRDKSLYTRIFRTETLDECRQWLSSKFNKELPNLHLQQNIKIDVDPTNKQIEKIKHFYRADYKNGWY